MGLFWALKGYLIMIISFGNVTELKKLDKPYTEMFTKDASFLTTNEVGNPVYKLEYDARLDNTNYARIGDNYFYMERPTHQNGFTFVTLHRDALKTFAPQIKNSIGTITRCSRGNQYIADNRAVATERVAVQYRGLGTPFKSGVTYIIVKGV